MIISCASCDKKFEVDSKLIPNNGRLLQCSVCNHKWFFKKDAIDNSIAPDETNDPIKETKPIKKEQLHTEEKDIENISLLDEEDKDIFVEKNISEKVSPNKDLQIVRSKNIKNYSILGIIIVFIITFIALIIILDTFHEPISKIVPNIEFLLYNLYESINDIKLFLKDLI
ncbi:zinc-ribbon domain-containing protein [Candidatus Pelagibacter sp.]|jgi:predicted Zn finger-like uncharacterized protein|nr:zinc-ribbon domain-containing protein [Candidatus Pelagibacter sp.]